MRKWMILLAMLMMALALGCAGAEGLAYHQALEAWKDVPHGQDDIEVDIFSYETEDVGLTEETIGEEKALVWRTGLGQVSFKVNVPAAGLYQLSIGYAQMDGASGQIERAIEINGEMQYQEQENFLFPKRFRDVNYPFEKNEYGNEIRPRQESVMESTKMLLTDRNRFYDEGLLFHFAEGENILTIKGIKGSLALTSITLKAPGAVPSYAEYIAAYENQGKGKTVIQEAEQLSQRSSKSIQNLTVSEPGITPEHAGYKLLNVLGGSNWDSAGDFVEWEIPVEESGLYALSFHYKQNFNTAMTSWRSVEIDGSVPYQELLAVGFPFNGGWKQMTPGGEKEPYLVWLDKGVHTLRLTSVNAPYRAVYDRLDALVDEMKTLDLSVKEIVGKDNDIYRIWKLEKYIPTIEEDLCRMVEEMKEIQGMLQGVVGNAENLGDLSAAISDLEKLSKDHNVIASKIDSLTNVYTIFSNWLEYMVSQPVMLDRIQLIPAGEKLPEAGAGFWRGLSYGFTSFFRSFFNTGDNMTADRDETVTVWVQRSRDYVDMMQLLADEYYTKQTGVKVNVSYCPPGSQLLVLANAAGEQPDIVTGVDIALPFDFGIRNALVDLSKQEGFDELVSHVAQGSRIPNYFSGAEYGIAEEIRVKVMFYRTDVLERMDIKVPQDWDDATDALSTLLQNNYAFFYPYGDYLTFFFQNDVDVYTEDGTGLAFTNEKGFAAFKQWTELYVKYGLQPARSSFYQHFRIGDVPLGIADIDQYIQFDMAAPDISGQWTIAMVPGTMAEDGVLQRWQAGTQTNAVMFKTTEKREERAWDFLRWWLSTDTQYLFADSMENYYGEEFRWFSANLDVVSMQAWPEDHKQVLLDQLSWYKQLPMVPGGSYMTSRELWNAWNRIVLDRGNYREEIEVTVEDIELEIGIKQRELGYIDEKGNILIPMDLMTIERPQGKEE